MSMRGSKTRKSEAERAADKLAREGRAAEQEWLQSEARATYETATTKPLTEEQIRRIVREEASDAAGGALLAAAIWYYS
jgi:hypothetical protein